MCLLKNWVMLIWNPLAGKYTPTDKPNGTNMIIEYHRPETIEAALALLARKEPRTVPLGGGSVLNQPSDIPVAVVDVQSLGLNQIAARQQARNWGRGHLTGVVGYPGSATRAQRRHPA
jgi:hypothetical protein